MQSSLRVMGKKILYYVQIIYISSTQSFSNRGFDF